MYVPYNAHSTLDTCAHAPPPLPPPHTHTHTHKLLTAFFILQESVAQDTKATQPTPSLSVAHPALTTPPGLTFYGHPLGDTNIRPARGAKLAR